MADATGEARGEASGDKKPPKAAVTAARYDPAAMAETHLLFVWKPTGYELEEREGDPPPVGAEVEQNGSTMTVVKIAQSPLPGDRRRCAYLEPAP